MFKVGNKDTRTTRRSGVNTVNFEDIFWLPCNTELLLPINKMFEFI